MTLIIFGIRVIKNSHIFLTFVFQSDKYQMTLFSDLLKAYIQMDPKENEIYKFDYLSEDGKWIRIDTDFQEFYYKCYTSQVQFCFNDKLCIVRE